MLNAGMGMMRTLVEGPRTSSVGFRSDGQTGMSDVDRRPYRVFRDAARKRALAILHHFRIKFGAIDVFRYRQDSKRTIFCLAVSQDVPIAHSIRIPAQNESSVRLYAHLPTHVQDPSYSMNNLQPERRSLHIE